MSTISNKGASRGSASTGGARQTSGASPNTSKNSNSRPDDKNRPTSGASRGQATTSAAQRGKNVADAFWNDAGADSLDPKPVGLSKQNAVSGSSPRRPVSPNSPRSKQNLSISTGKKVDFSDNNVRIDPAKPGQSPRNASGSSKNLPPRNPPSAYSSNKEGPYDNRGNEGNYGRQGNRNDIFDDDRRGSSNYDSKQGRYNNNRDGYESFSGYQDNNKRQDNRNNKMDHLDYRNDNRNDSYGNRYNDNSREGSRNRNDYRADNGYNDNYPRNDNRYNSRDDKDHRDNKDRYNHQRDRSGNDRDYRNKRNDGRHSDSSDDLNTRTYSHRDNDTNNKWDDRGRQDKYGGYDDHRDRENYSKSSYGKQRDNSYGRDRYDERRKDDGYNDRGRDDSRNGRGNQPHDRRDTSHGGDRNRGGGNQQHSAETEELLKRISNFMAKYNAHDLDRAMATSRYNGVRAVELLNFVDFLQGRALGFNAQQAMLLAKEYTMPDHSGWKSKQRSKGRSHYDRYVDLERLEADVLEVQQQGETKKRFQDYRRTRDSGYRLVERLREAAYEYIAYGGGSVFKCFQMLDTERANYLTPDTLLRGLRKLGLEDLSQADARQLIEILDDNGDGKVSYMEFTDVLSDCDGGKTIDDPHHWAFYLFEDIRRKLARNDRPLAEVFGTRRPAKGRDGKAERVLIAWPKFLKALRDLPARMATEEETELLELLDVDGQGGTVDLHHFVALLGIEDDHSAAHAATHKRRQECLTKWRAEKNYDEKEHGRRRADARYIMRLLLGRGVTVNRMRQELLWAKSQKSNNYTVQSRRATTIPRSIFIEVLDHECDPGQKLEARRLEQIADIFSSSSSTSRDPEIDFEAFLSALASTIAMASTMAYLFGQISAYCKEDEARARKPCTLNATAVLNIALREDQKRNPNKHSGSGPSSSYKTPDKKEFTAAELSDALSGLQIYLSRDEEALLLLEYDIRGDGRYFDLAALETDFDEWKTQEYHEKHQKHRHDLYGQCAEPHGDRHRGQTTGGRPALRPEWRDAAQRYGFELKSIVDGMASRHSGTLAWLRHHCQGSTVRKSEFVKSIEALGISSTGVWTVSAGRLFEALLPPGADSMPMGDLDDLLKHIQNESIGHQLAEEQTLVEVIQGLNGDDGYLSAEIDRLEREKDSQARYPARNNGLAITDLASWLSRSIRSLGAKQRELESMIRRYGSDTQQPTVVDLRAFIRAFQQLRDRRGIVAGRFNVAAADNRRPTQPSNYGPGPTNPLMPGQSPTQTRAGLDRAAAHPPAGYRSPYGARPEDFQDIMKGAYALDVLVEDHFAEYAHRGAAPHQQRQGGRAPEPNRGLDERAFADAVNQLQVSWPAGESERIFRQLVEAFGANKSYNSELLAHQIDLVVHLESQSTIPQLQDRALDILRNEVQRDGIEIRSALENHQYETKNARGRVNPAEASRAMRRLLPQARVSDVDLQVLLKRYIVADQIDYRKLADDLQPGGRGHHRPTQGGADSRFDMSSRVNEEQLHALQRRIVEALNKDVRGGGGARARPGIPGLHEVLARSEAGGSSGGIPGNAFCSAIRRMTDMQLTKADEGLLLGHYAHAQRRGDVEKMVDYRRFLEDLKTLAAPGGKRSVALTRDQEELISRVKKSFKDQDRATRKEAGATAAKLMAALKTSDSSGRGYLEGRDIADGISRVGLQHALRSAGRDGVLELCSCLKPNAQGRYPYKELFELLCGAREAAELYAASIDALERGTWRQGSAKPAAFVQPKATQGAETSTMASIGERILALQVNYEDILLRASGADPAAGSPTISDRRLQQALHDMGVKLSTAEQRELDSFLRDRASSPGTVQLTRFLAAVGLPAQTVGVGASAPGQAQKLLTDTELAQAAKILASIRRQCEQLRINPKRMFENTKADVADIALRPSTFVSCIKRELGGEFSQRIEVEEQLGLLVPYLSEDVPNQISYNKLALAMTRGEKDQPLTQHGTEELLAYQARIREEASRSVGAGAPVAVVDFVGFLKAGGHDIWKLLKPEAQKAQRISVTDFKAALAKIRYDQKAGKDVEKLIDALVEKSNNNRGKQEILVSKLKKHIENLGSVGAGKAKPVRTAAGAQAALARFDVKVRSALQRISDYLKREGMTTKDLHSRLDENRDGSVDKREFVTVMRYVEVPGLLAADLGMIFDALDINDDGALSLDEFSLFLEGAQQNTMERIRNMDPDLREGLQAEIRELFDSFDADGDGRVTAEEIRRTLQSFGRSKTIEECQEMVRSVGGGSEGLGRQQFGTLMLPVMQEQLLGQEDNAEDLRARFLEADVDNSGFLTVDELWAAIRRMGVEVELEDVVQLMSEIDIDRDGKLDVDEFVSLMNLGDQLRLDKHANSKRTHFMIKKARGLNPLDFLKCFKHMPTNFSPSFVDEAWSKNRRNLPSSVFSAQIDPSTMLWKDVLEPASEDQKDAGKGSKPFLKPIESQAGCMLTISDAQGVPLPIPGQGAGAFKDDDIVKRAVRIAIEHAPASSIGQKASLVHNAIQVPAIWDRTAEDVWSFDTSDKSLRSVLFRTTAADGLDKGRARLLMELVVYVKTAGDKDKVTEMSCGWCELPISELTTRAMTHKLEIHGGSPTAEVQIHDKDLRTNRKGLSFMKKVVTGGVEKRLSVEVRPLLKLPPETRYHLEMMPSTCLVHKSLLYFMSGFMNYKAGKLLREASSAIFRKPAGDAVIASLPKIYDCPDIVEELTQIWTEDVQPLIDKRRMEISYIVTKTQEFISRLYPILYADEFKSIEHSAATRSAAAEPDLLVRRKALINSALRYNQVHTVKSQVRDAPCELTSFKPFSLRELEYDVWDTKRSKQDKYLAQFNSRGLLQSGAGPAPVPLSRPNEPHEQYRPPYQDDYPPYRGAGGQGQAPGQYAPQNSQYGQNEYGQRGPAGGPPDWQQNDAGRYQSDGRPPYQAPDYARGPAHDQYPGGRDQGYNQGYQAQPPAGPDRGHPGQYDPRRSGHSPPRQDRNTHYNAPQGNPPQGYGRGPHGDSQKQVRFAKQSDW